MTFIYILSLLDFILLFVYFSHKCPWKRPHLVLHVPQKRKASRPLRPDRAASEQHSRGGQPVPALREKYGSSLPCAAKNPLRFVLKCDVVQSFSIYAAAMVVDLVLYSGFIHA